MIVRVRLLGELRKYLQGQPEPLTLGLAEPGRVADVASLLGIASGVEVVVGVNGLLGGLDSVLKDGDEVVLVSPMSGGRASTTRRTS